MLQAGALTLGFGSSSDLAAQQEDPHRVLSRDLIQGSAIRKEGALKHPDLAPPQLAY
jgi:hypothetical protein